MAWKDTIKEEWMVIALLIISVLYYSTDCSMGGGSVPANVRGIGEMAPSNR